VGELAMKRVGGGLVLSDASGVKGQHEAHKGQLTVLRQPRMAETEEPHRWVGWQC
jgi:hypothetical protein